MLSKTQDVLINQKLREVTKISSESLTKMSKKFAIIGGAGFLGSNLAGALAAENEVIVIDDLSTRKLENPAGIDIKIVRGSVTDPMLLKSAFEDVDCVFYLAATVSVQKSVEDPVRSNEVNIGGALNTLVAARNPLSSEIVPAAKIFKNIKGKNT